MHHDTYPQKAEINETIQNMHSRAFAVGILLIAIYAYAVSGDALELRRLVVVMAISIAFTVAQGDYRIARLGQWVRRVENDYPVRPWEEYKNRLKSRKLILPITDLGMAAAPLYALYRSGEQLYLLDPQFFLWAMTGVTLGVIMVFVGQALARW